MTFNEIVKQKHDEALKKAEQSALQKKCKKLALNKLRSEPENYNDLYNTIKNIINKKIGEDVFACKNGIIKIKPDYRQYFSKIQEEGLLDKISAACTSFLQSQFSDYNVLLDDVSSDIACLLKNKQAEEIEEK